MIQPTVVPNLAQLEAIEQAYPLASRCPDMVSWSPPHPLAFTPDEIDQALRCTEHAPIVPTPCGAVCRELQADQGSLWVDRVNTILTEASVWWGLQVSTWTGQRLTYGPGIQYAKHRHVGPGSACQKYAVVVQLTDPSEYEGGDFTVYSLDIKAMNAHENRYDAGYEIPIPAPRDQGTVIVAPAWVPHAVTPIASGLRHSFTIAVWGDALR
jgi:hypothetical protein